MSIQALPTFISQLPIFFDLFFLIPVWFFLFVFFFFLSSGLEIHETSFKISGYHMFQILFLAITENYLQRAVESSNAADCIRCIKWDKCKNVWWVCGT